MIFLSLLAAMCIYCFYILGKIAEFLAVTATIRSRRDFKWLKGIAFKTLAPSLPLIIESLPILLVFIVWYYRDDRKYYSQFTTRDLKIQQDALIKRIKYSTVAVYTALFTISLLAFIIEGSEMKNTNLRFVGFFYTLSVLTLVWYYNISYSNTKADKIKVNVGLFVALIVCVILYIYSTGLILF